MAAAVGVCMCVCRWGEGGLRNECILIWLKQRLCVCVSGCVSLGKEVNAG